MLWNSFILNCPQYETLRGKYKIFSDVDNDIQSVNYWIQLTRDMREICSFLKEAFEINKSDSVSVGPT